MLFFLLKIRTDIFLQAENSLNCTIFFQHYYVLKPIITQWTCAFRLASLSQRNVLVRKVNMYTIFKQAFPKNSYLFTLCNRVCRNKSSSDCRASHKIRCFFVPTRNIIQISVVFYSVKNTNNVFFLFDVHNPCPSNAIQIL